MERQRKRGAGNLPAAAQPAHKKVLNLGQRRVEAGHARGTKNDPVVLVSEGPPEEGANKRRQPPASVLDLSTASSSGKSADAHLLLDDVQLQSLQQQAQPDGYGAAAAPAQAAAAVRPPETDAGEEAVPKKVQVGTSATYTIHQRLGKGGFGQVYLGAKTVHGRATTKPARVAVKFEKRAHDQAAYEWGIYKDISESYGLGRFYSKGRVGDWNVMIMELLGRSLFDMCMEVSGQFTHRMLACVAVESITMLYHLHRKGYVHGDVKPENLVLGKPAGSEPPRLHLVDLGLTVTWRNKVGITKPYCSELNNFRGTTRYASLHAHLGRVAMPRDDLESLAYSLLFLALGYLPWQGFEGDDEGKRPKVAAVKASRSAAHLCMDVPPPLRAFTEAVTSLGYGEQPDYAAYVAMFSSVASCGPGPMPLTLAPLSMRPAPLPANDEAAAPKRQRQGLQSQQYLLVFNQRRSHKQWYVAGATTAKLEENVVRGWQQNMHINSAVAGPDGSWNVTLESGLGYTQQAYEVADSLVSREFVMKRWEDGHYITAIAGLRHRQRSLTVVSKGTPFTQQSYKVADAFPYEWVKKKWGEGYFVTAAGTAQNMFAVVMSKNAPFLRQVVEVDYAYPSEGIHQHWKAGLRITACASTPLQTAVVLTKFKRGPKHKEQETLRTDAWPAKAIKQKWEAGMYISATAYGRTLH